MKTAWKYARGHFITCLILAIATVIAIAVMFISPMMGSVFVGVSFFVCLLFIASAAHTIDLAAHRKRMSEDEEEWGCVVTNKITLSEIRGDSSLIQLLQPDVNKRLTVLARGFASADMRERKACTAIEKLTKGSASLEPGEKAERYRSLQEDVGLARHQLGLAKKDFWKFHGICKRAGFTVYQNFTDYTGENRVVEVVPLFKQLDRLRGS